MMQFDVVRTPSDLIGMGAYGASPDCPMGTSFGRKTLRCIQRYMILLGPQWDKSFFNEFAFKTTKERLRDCVIPAVVTPTDARAQTVIFAPAIKGIEC
jgi:hypothetical protein